MQLLVLIFPKDSHLDFAKSLTRSAGCLPVKIPLCHGHLTRIQTGILMSGLQRHFHHTQGMPILLADDAGPRRELVAESSGRMRASGFGGGCRASLRPSAL